MVSWWAWLLVKHLRHDQLFALMTSAHLQVAVVEHEP